MKVLLFRLLIINIILLTSLTALPRLRGFTLVDQMATEDLQALQQFGPNIVRLSLYNDEADYQTAEEYQLWLDSRLVELDSQLITYASIGVKVILNLHTPPGGFATYAFNGSPGMHQHRVFADALFAEQLSQTWLKISNRYLNNSTIHGYELMNEPAQPGVAAGLQNWNSLAQKLVNEIRSIDQNKTIFISPIYSDPSNFSKLKKIRGSKISYIFNFYFKLAFHHQGLDGRPINIDYPTKRFNINGINNYLKAVKNFQTKYRVKNIHVGEFTAIRWAPNNSAIKYLKDVIKIFEANRWGWTYHSYRGRNYSANTDIFPYSLEHDQNHNSLLPSVLETDRAALIKSYLSRNLPVN